MLHINLLKARSWVWEVNKNGVVEGSLYVAMLHINLLKARSWVWEVIKNGVFEGSLYVAMLHPKPKTQNP